MTKMIRVVDLQIDEIKNWDAVEKVLEWDRRTLENRTCGPNKSSYDKLIEEIAYLENLLKIKEQKGL